MDYVYLCKKYDLVKNDEKDVTHVQQPSSAVTQFNASHINILVIKHLTE